VELRQGSIVWAEVQDQAGRNPKCRPAVVLTATDKIVSGEDIFVVAATSRFFEPLPSHKIKLPWMRGGHPTTGLYMPCIVVCNWLLEISQSQVRSVGGIVPPSIMEAILLQVRRLLDE
jgi:hypothetical protein